MQEHLASAKSLLRATCTGCARSIDSVSAAERCPICGGLLFMESVPLEEGTIIEERYQIIRKVGVGAWGAVYSAKQLGVERTVALKFLHEHLVISPGKLERFKQEGRALRELSHEGVAAIYDLGVHNKQPYIVQEFVEGETLKDVYHRRNALTGKSVKALFAAILDVLQEAHTKGIVHRDIKPSNIIVSDFGERPSVRLLDFGIAKLTATENAAPLTAAGDVLGTPLYMSPEQCMSESIDRRSDLYSVGCMLHEALSGQPPFVTESSLECMLKHCDHPPPDLRQIGIADEYALVVEKALAKKPEDRFQTADEFRAAVLSLPDVVTLPVESLAPNAAPSTVPLRSIRSSIMLAVTVAAVLLASVIIYLHSKPQTINLLEQPKTVKSPQVVPSKDVTASRLLKFYRQSLLLPSGLIGLAGEFGLDEQGTLVHIDAKTQKIMQPVSLPPALAGRHFFQISGSQQMLYLIDEANHIRQWQPLTAECKDLGEAPVGGAGFCYFEPENCLIFFNRTDETPGALTKITKVDLTGKLRAQVPIAEIQTWDNFQDPEYILQLAADGNTLLASVPQEDEHGLSHLLIALDPVNGRQLATSRVHSK